MFWSKKNKEEGLPDLAPPPGPIPSMKDYTRSDSSKTLPDPFPNKQLPPSSSFPIPEKSNVQEKHESIPLQPDTQIPKLPEFNNNILPPQSNPHTKVIEMEEWKPEEHEAPEETPFHEEHPLKSLEPPPIHEEHHLESAEPSPIHDIHPPEKKYLDKPVFVKIEKFRNG